MSSQRVRRFPQAFVAQHGLLIFTFTALCVTGFPLRWRWFGFVNALGGYEAVQAAHHVIGVLMVVQGVVHVVHALLHQARHQQRGGLWPAARDLRDMLHDTRYLLGREPHRARYPRYSYINKFDYWGAFWGVAIMGCTGLVLWFPQWFSNTLIHVSFIAHTDEAVLAAGAIFIWHLYHVHTLHGKPRLNRVWLDGHIGAEELKREHPEEYDALVARGELADG